MSGVSSPTIWSINDTHTLSLSLSLTHTHSLPGEATDCALENCYCYGTGKCKLCSRLDIVRIEYRVTHFVQCFPRPIRKRRGSPSVFSIHMLLLWCGHKYFEVVATTPYTLMPWGIVGREYLSLCRQHYNITELDRVP